MARSGARTQPPPQEAVPAFSRSEQDLTRPLHPELLEQARHYGGHALLLSGPARVGKRALALQVAAYQNCAQFPSDLAPCGVCASCRAAVQNAHPDLLLLAPRATTATGKAARRRIIPIGAIHQDRDDAHEYDTHVHGFVELRPTYRRRVVLVDGAEFLNEQAANALLKMVEEPPHNALFLFLTEDVGLVMPTISSRSARLNVTPLPDAQLERGLALEGRAASPELLALAAGRRGVLDRAGQVEQALEAARSLTAALRGPLMGALEAAEELEKHFDPEWHPQALRHVWQAELPGVQARADDALERLTAALEGYASPSLAFQVFVLELRAAFGI